MDKSFSFPSLVPANFGKAIDFGLLFGGPLASSDLLRCGSSARTPLNWHSGTRRQRRRGTGIGGRRLIPSSWRRLLTPQPDATTGVGAARLPQRSLGELERNVTNLADKSVAFIGSYNAQHVGGHMRGLTLQGAREEAHSVGQIQSG